MAREKKEDPPKGAPAWQATFSDLMNLLLCFFVLLFAMSSIDEAKMELIIASFHTRFNVLEGGSATIMDGDAIGSGLMQLQQYDTIYMPDANSMGKGSSDYEGIIEDTTHNDAHTDNPENPDITGNPEGEGENLPAGENGDASGTNSNAGGGGEQSDTTEAVSAEQAAEQARQMDDDVLTQEYERRALTESERIYNMVNEQLSFYGLQNQVEASFNAQYVMLTLNGAILFDSGQVEVREDAMPLVEKLAVILDNFKTNIIEVEGHTDNVPIHSGKYEDNNVLSMYRALTVADYLRDNTSLNPALVKSSGRGDYLPIADNTTPEGRALNRRVVIKLYNSYNSDLK